MEAFSCRQEMIRPSFCVNPSKESVFCLGCPLLRLSSRSSDLQKVTSASGPVPGSKYCYRMVLSSSAVPEHSFHSGQGDLRAESAQAYIQQICSHVVNSVHLLQTLQTGGEWKSRLVYLHRDFPITWHGVYPTLCSI